MTTSCRKKVAILLLTLIITGCSDSSFRQKTRENFNIIVIVIDALRFDHLGCYGYERDTSPTIDKISMFQIDINENACIQKCPYYNTGV